MAKKRTKCAICRDKLGGRERKYCMSCAKAIRKGKLHR